MSKPSDRKKARRQKRVARNVVWARLTDELDGLEEPVVGLAPRNVTEVILGAGGSVADGYPDDVVDLAEQASRFERRITKRGWVFCAELSTMGHATWYWVPSECELPEDDVREQFTSVSLMIPDEGIGEDYDFPTSIHLFLVGCDKSGYLHYRLAPDEFLAHIDAIEAFRVDGPVPALG